MIALVVLLLILALFGGLGFVANALWLILVAALVLWLFGFVVGGPPTPGSPWYRGRWYRW